jgi:hypothetical protein
MNTLNPISFYEECGRLAAVARNRRDESSAQMTVTRINRALRLESNEARPVCRRAYENSYRVENGLPPMTAALRAATVACEQAQGIQQTANEAQP